MFCGCSANESLDKQGKKHLKQLFKPISKTKNFAPDNAYLLVGTPNVGKSTFFNKVTWQNSPVGNADRITVTTKIGSLRSDYKIKILDTPGIYNLNPTSYDENIAIKTIFNQKYFGCINIISAKSLKRDLLLTTQLLEAGIVKEIVVNMIDEFYEGQINGFKLSQKLKTKVQLVAATKNIGVKQTIKSLIVDQAKLKSNFKLNYPQEIENIIVEIKQHIPDQLKLDKRFIAVQYLEANTYVHELFNEWGINKIAHNILKSHHLTLNKTKQLIKETRTNFINNLLTITIQKNSDETVIAKNQKKILIQQKLDKVFLNKWFGAICFILVIIGIYYLTFGNYAGGYINEQWTGLLEQGQDAIKNAIAKSMGENASHGLWVQNFVADGLLGGIFTVVGFAPYIIIMFFLINLIEQTGYLSRVSLLVDKQFERFGLSGKSVITLITGIGCNIPAVMMARNCHSLKERTIVLMITPFMSCSARLLVFVWIANAFVSAKYAWLVGVGFTFFSGFITLLAGLLFSQTMFRDSNTFLLTELPTWKLPDLQIVLKKVALEFIDFLKRVMTIIFLVNLVMFFLMYISPTSGLIDDWEILSKPYINWNQASLLQYIGIPFQYLFYPIGLGQDWRFATSLLSAAPAKEIAASNISLLFGGGGEVDGTTAQGFVNALFKDGNVTLPYATLMSYLVMFTFYTPCLSTTVVMKKEGGIKNTFIHLGAAIGLSYLLCLIFYSSIGSIEKIIQFNNNGHYIANNPLAIIAWILLAVGTLTLLISFIIKQHLNNSNKPVLLSTTKKYYLVYIISSSIIILGMFFMLCFIFII